MLRDFQEASSAEIHNMNRRYFTQQMGIGLSGAFLGVPGLFTDASSLSMKSIKAKKLKPGATIGLVSPASSISDQKIQTAVTNLEGLGFRLVFGKNAKAQKGYLAGEDQGRIDDLHQFFQDDKIDGIWCLRGGYGSARLLPDLDYKLIRKNPKVLIGYSDITALLNSIYKKCGLLGFHGPVASSTFTDFTVQSLQSMLLETTIPPPIQLSEDKAYTIRSGQAEGKLVGGNLSLISALSGSPYLPKFKNKIVFLEDVGEKPYRIDRMLTHLLYSTDLHKAAAIVLGVFAGCEADPDDKSLSLKETLQDRLGQISIPVVYGFPFGHVADNATLAIGMRTSLDTATGKLSFLESPIEE